MSAWNAGVTVVGIVGGYALSGGSLAAAILGNALGNVAGCAAGWRALRARELFVGRALAGASALFLALLGAGVAHEELLARSGALAPAAASVVTTALFTAPLALWTWRGTRAPRALTSVTEASA
jgi:hypothetical protein